MSPWLVLENIVLILVAAGLAYAWDTVWPLVLLLFANIRQKDQP